MISKKLQKILNNEIDRQNNTLNLIASENFVSDNVLKFSGNVFTNKYAEGYPNKRYYGGCKNVDELELYGINIIKKLFNAESANIQPHSGSQANEAVLNSILMPNDKILGMSLTSGGHLTHGYKLNNSGKLYESYFYDVDPKTEKIDYKEIEKLAFKIKPKLIICGASCYSRKINWQKFSQIAKKVGCLFISWRCTYKWINNYRFASKSIPICWFCNIYNS